MTAENTATQNVPATKTVMKERFEFILTINDNIVCQRYFKIPYLISRSLYSRELLETFDYCVSMIQRELISKSNMYNWYAAPQVFKNMDEFKEWTAKYPIKMEVPCYVIIKEESAVYTWNGEELALYTRKFTIPDFIGEAKDENECTLKFTVIDNGVGENPKTRLLYSRMWDGTVYPRFIRNNIDLSNQKNRYAGDEENFYNFLLMNTINYSRNDLVFKLINEIVSVCSDKNIHYTTSEKYGKKKYLYDIEKQEVETITKIYDKK